MAEIKRNFVLRHEIENFPNLKGVWSRTETHFNVPWKMLMYRRDDHFCLYIKCDKTTNSNLWSVKADVAFSIATVKGSEETKKGFTHCFIENKGWGFDNFISWEEVLDKFMVNNTVTVECRVTVRSHSGFYMEKQLSFENPVKGITDLVLAVDDEKFHVSKSILANSCSVFFKLFANDAAESDEEPEEGGPEEEDLVYEARKKTIIVAGVNSEDFECFLQTVYGCTSKITVDNVDGLLKLARRFQSGYVTRKCQQFVLKSKQMKLETKLTIAGTHRLSDVQASCLDSLKTKEDLKHFLHGSHNFEEHTSNLLLKKALSFL